MDWLITRVAPALAVAGVLGAYLTFGEGLDFGSPRRYEAPDDPQFQRDVIDSPVPTLVKFGADWCPPCRALEAELDGVCDEFGGRVRVIRVNVDERGDLAGAYGVHGIPHLALFRDGNVVAERVGYADRDALVRWVEANW